MFGKLLAWFKSNLTIFLIIGCSLIGSIGYMTYQSIMFPPDLKEFKGSIQNHLLWSIDGTCYFVRPNTTATVYLVAVPDCNKSK